MQLPSKIKGVGGEKLICSADVGHWGRTVLAATHSSVDLYAS